jgi:uncharacterized protein (DUF2461 family)
VTDAGAETRLPKTRDALFALHRDLRHRRDAAPLESHERARAMADIARVEVEIARLDRSADPPRL